MKIKNKLKIQPYSADYPRKFNEYQKLILQQLEGYEVDVHHVGSTAVEGLGGKGFIDILIGLPNWDKEEKIIAKLKDLGFTHIHPKENERIFMSKPPENIENYDAHLHLALIGSKPYREIIYFRDYLRDNPQKAQKYFDLKLELLESTGADREKYTQRKAEFIEQICEQIK